jgi:hypothetical protein
LGNFKAGNAFAHAALRAMDNNIDTLKGKLRQAQAVIERLIGETGTFGSEGQRALDYFASDTFDPNFLPWPSHGDDGLRPEELNAANDD